MVEPTRQEVDDFIRSNDIDERAASDLRNCSGDIQRKVLARGELSTARNPSAALLARIRDARSSPTTSGNYNSNAEGSAEVEEFIKHNDVDESAADMLRSSSPGVQRSVLSRGELKTARNPSSALLSRIRDAKLGISTGPPSGDRGRDYDRYDRDRNGGGSGGGGMPPAPALMPPAAAGMPPPGYPYGYGMYGYGYPGYPGYPGMPPPQADSRYGGGAMPPGGYPGYPGYPPPAAAPGAPGAPPGAPGAPPPSQYGGYPGYSPYAGYGMSGNGMMPYGAPPGAYGAAPGAPPAAAPQAALTDGATAERQRGRRSRSRSSSSSYSRSPSRSRRRRRGRK